MEALGGGHLAHQHSSIRRVALASFITSRTSLGLLRPGGHNSTHPSISNGLAIVLIHVRKDPQVDPSDRRLLAEEIRGSVEFGSC